MNAPIHTPGIYRDLSSEHYHSDTAVGNTMLSDLKDSPAHCWARHLNPNRPERKVTDALRLGSFTHMSILEPEKVRHHYTTKPDGLNLNSNAGKEWKDAMQGLEIVTVEEVAMAEAQRAAVMADPLLASFFTHGESEVSVFWIDKATGMRCKCRPDRIQYVGPNRVRVLDLKTTPDVVLDSVSKSVFNFGYHRQQAHYTRGIEAQDLIVEEFVFAFVTKAYPFFAIPYVLDDETQMQGDTEVSELLSLYANCYRSGNWPLTSGGVQVVGLPGWARREQEIEVSYVS